MTLVLLALSLRLRRLEQRHHERFDGLTLTKLDGQRIRIANGRVQPA